MFNPLLSKFLIQQQKRWGKRNNRQRDNVAVSTLEYKTFNFLKNGETEESTETKNNTEENVGLPNVGDKTEHIEQIRERDIQRFANVCGDKNPLHLHEIYAKDSRFGRTIAHGVIVDGVVSASLNKFNGLVILLNKETRYEKPVYAGDFIKAQSEIVEQIEEGENLNNRYRVKTTTKKVNEPQKGDYEDDVIIKYEEDEKIGQAQSTILVDKETEHQREITGEK